jgi:hypothetical protein
MLRFPSSLSLFFFFSLSLFTVLVYQVPCGRLFPLFSFVQRGSGVLSPATHTHPLFSFFSFWTTQHEIQHKHPWEAHPAWDLNPADLAVVSGECLPSTTLPSAPTRHTHTSMARRSSLPSKKSSPFGGIRTH